MEWFGAIVREKRANFFTCHSYLIVFANHCDVRFSNVKAQITFIGVGECAID
jgi:hypothetical protein